MKGRYSNSYHRKTSVHGSNGLTSNQCYNPLKDAYGTKCYLNQIKNHMQTEHFGQSWPKSSQNLPAIKNLSQLK